jgi:hypothetical protein
MVAADRPEVPSVRLNSYLVANASFERSNARTGTRHHAEVPCGVSETTNRPEIPGVRLV